MENNKFPKPRIKNRKLEDFNLDNILIDEKSYKDIVIYDVTYKILFGCRLDSIKQMELKEIMMDLDI